MNKLKCINCEKKLIGKQTSYCSSKCHGIIRRKDPKYKEQIAILRKKWEVENKDRRLKYHRMWEYKNREKRIAKTKKWLAKHPTYYRDYHHRPKAVLRESHYKKTNKAKNLRKIVKQRFLLNHPQYWKELFNKNPDVHKEYRRKYRKSDRGIATQYKRYDQKRRRNMIYLNKNLDLPTDILIKMLRERDKICFYCDSPFNYSNSNNLKYPTFDHINPELPLNNVNAVLACRECNSSKNRSEVLSWLNKKGYYPSEELLELLKKQDQLMISNKMFINNIIEVI